MSLKTTFQNILDELKDNDEAFSQIALIGQPGAGKSSIINALMGAHVAETGASTDTTKDAMKYRYNFNLLVDLPGYGTDMFNMQTWKDKFNPAQYDVFVFVFSGKLMREDVEMLNTLIELKKSDSVEHPIFLVRNHCEDIANDEEIKRISEDIYGAINDTKDEIPLYFVDCKSKKGFTELSHGFQSINYRKIWEQRIISSFRKECKKVLNGCILRACFTIENHSYVAAANGINPIPVLDTTVDLGIYFDMFSDIRNIYNIDEEDLERYSIVPKVKIIVELATKKGLLMFLKNFPGKVAIKNAMKFIPVIGCGASVGLGYKMCEWVGEEYIGDCNEAANEILEIMIKKQIEEWANNKSMIVLGGA
ncbi:GTPase [Anaerovibrio sp.]|uniref:GTPase n=1 Tax=Anaerovibrio sp. TaxID=1872532 RepID=UPI0025BB77B3|nr:GTPase [Anaerovibrio sp.]MBR2142959.1 50S ribosome-binding GTPase [Anaerovibrio sp.]